MLFRSAGGAAFTLYLLRRRINILGFLGTSAWFWFIVNSSKVPLSLWLGQINAESLHQVTGLPQRLLLACHLEA